jgi:hypothetical protein
MRWKELSWAYGVRRVEERYTGTEEDEEEV